MGMPVLYNSNEMFLCLGDKLTSDVDWFWLQDNNDNKSKDNKDNKDKKKEK